MIPNETREKAYLEIDMLLHRLEFGPLGENPVYVITSRPAPPPAHSHIMDTILREYKLIETKPSQNLMYGTERFLTMNGMRALTAGGIREYMIDTDPAIVIHDGYPMVVSVITKDGLYLSKHFISVSLRS
jgi:hypothetical protein